MKCPTFHPNAVLLLPTQLVSWGGVGYYTNIITSFSTRFIHPAWGFAMGWNYALPWLASLPFELTAASITIQVNICISPIHFHSFFFPLFSHMCRESIEIKRQHWDAMPLVGNLLLDLLQLDAWDSIPSMSLFTYYKTRSK